MGHWVSVNMIAQQSVCLHRKHPDINVTYKLFALRINLLPTVGVGGIHFTVKQSIITFHMPCFCIPPDVHIENTKM